MSWGGFPTSPTTPWPATSNSADNVAQNWPRWPMSRTRWLSSCDAPRIRIRSGEPGCQEAVGAGMGILGGESPYAGRQGVEAHEVLLPRQLGEYQLTSGWAAAAWARLTRPAKAG